MSETSSDPSSSSPEGRHRAPAGEQSAAPFPGRTTTGIADPATPEKTLWVGRTNWKHYYGTVLRWAAVSAALLVGGQFLKRLVDPPIANAVFWVLVALVVIGALFVFGRVFLRVAGIRYRLTNERLFLERGILSRAIDQLELIRVDDVNLRLSFVDRIFGLGTVTVFSSDATHRAVVIEGVKDAGRVAEHIRARMKALRARAVYVESV